MKKILFVLVSLVMSLSMFAQDGSYMTNKWHCYIDAGMGALVHGTDGYHAVLVGGSITVGYQVTDYLNTGLGVSPVGTVDSWGCGGKSTVVVSVYTQARLDDVKKKISPYMQFRIGGEFGEHNTKALYLNVGAGVRIRHFSIGVGYSEEVNDGSAGYFLGKIGVVF